MGIKLCLTAAVFALFSFSAFAQNARDAAPPTPQSRIGAGLLDSEILDVALGENYIVAASRSGVSWRYKSDGKWGDWKNIREIPFAAQESATLDNAVSGVRSFAVRLNPGEDERISFLHYRQDRDAYEIRDIFASQNRTAFGYDGFFDEYFNAGTFFFASGSAGIASIIEGLGESAWSIENFTVNSVFGGLSGRSIIALSPEGTILWHSWDGTPNFDTLGALKLEKDRYSEYALKFVKDFSDASVLVLTTDTAGSAFGNERVWRFNANGEYSVFLDHRDIAKIALTPDGFIYILNSYGNLEVLDADGKLSSEARTRQRVMAARFAKVNVSAGYAFTDICVLRDKHDKNKYSVAFASTKGIFYSPDEIAGLRDESAFEYFYKAVPIRGGLKDIYAEPGILSAQSGENYATFQYALNNDDNVTIDIFNYNLDFVLRIVENAFRPAAVEGEHSTDKRADRWDGTVNNQGGRRVSPGVYYFKISNQKGKQANFGRIVIAR